MLILTRKIDQAIVIKDNILVRVLGVERDRVKLGICAPEEIVILREELLQTEVPKNGQAKGEKPLKPARPPANGGPGGGSH